MKKGLIRMNNAASVRLDELKNYLKGKYGEKFDMMVDSCKSYFKIHQLVLTYFPFDSEVGYDLINSWRSYVLEPDYPMEYVLCIKKQTPFEIFKFIPVKRCEYVPRYICEYNPDYVQISVGAILETNKIDETTGNKQYIFEKSLSGPLKNRYTMIQGHTSYNPKYDNFRYLSKKSKNEERLYPEDAYPGLIKVESPKAIITEYCKEEVLREISEEVKSVNRVMINTDNTIFIPNTLNMRELDFYHIGMIFKGEITAIPGTELESNEPEKHELVYSTLNTIKNMTVDAKDSWMNRTDFHLI